MVAYRTARRCVLFVPRGTDDWCFITVFICVLYTAFCVCVFLLYEICTCEPRTWSEASVTERPAAPRTPARGPAARAAAGGAGGGCGTLIRFLVYVEVTHEVREKNCMCTRLSLPSLFIKYIY